MPAKQRGWKEVVSFEKPVKTRDNRIELQRLTFRKDAFRCSACKGSKHILLKLMGWQTEAPVAGTGVASRCFKHDITCGSASEEEYAEIELVKKEITEREAIDVAKKYGIHVAWLQPTL